MGSPVWTLIVFIAAIAGIIICINISPKITLFHKSFTISYLYPPLLGCILLLITLQMSPKEMLDAIIGGGSVEPYTIILLVISIALVCISLDYTGALSYVSWRLISTFATTKLRLFVIIFLISTFFSILASNDVVVMTITPLVIYCAQFSATSATPFLYASFYGANLGSFLFVVGNPTNVIVAQAFGVTFAQYTWYMFFPAIVCAVLGFVVILVVCRHELGLNMEDLIPIAPVQECLRMRALKRQHREFLRKNQLETASTSPSRDISPSDDPPLAQSSDAYDGDHNSLGHQIDRDQRTDLDDLTHVSHHNLSPSGTKQAKRHDPFGPQSDINRSNSTLSPSQSYHWPGTNPVDVDDEIRDRGDVEELPYTTSSYEKKNRTKLRFPPYDATKELKDKRGAIFQASLLLVCLIMMAASSFIYDGIKIYMVSCACCVLSLIYDVIAYPIFPIVKIGQTLVVEKNEVGDGGEETALTLTDPIQHHLSTTPQSTTQLTISADQRPPTLLHDKSVVMNAHDGSPHFNQQQINPSESQRKLSNQPSAINLSQVNYHSTHSNLMILQQQQQQQQRLHNPPKVVDPFAFDMEAIDSVDHADTYISAQPGAYHNPFTSDEYELVDSANLDSATATVVVTTEVIVQDGLDRDSNGGSSTTTGRELCVANILKALPYDAPVFVCCMFILVQSLVKTGWVGDLAVTILNMGGGLEQIASVTPDLSISDIPSKFTWQLTLAFGIVELILCNIMNNQPATILMTYVLLQCRLMVQTYQTNHNLIPTNPDTQELAFSPDIHQHYLGVMIYATIAASNYAAIVTLVASLAGIIFSNIVKTKLDQMITQLEAQIGNADDEMKKDDLIERQKSLKKQYISFLQFASRGLYALPFIFFGVSFAIVAAAQYATT